MCLALSSLSIYQNISLGWVWMLPVSGFWRYNLCFFPKQFFLCFYLSIILSVLYWFFWDQLCVLFLRSGPRELTGAVDLISHFKLLPHHDFFCKKSLPLSISDTHYLHNVVGDTEIRKGEGMQLGQLIQDRPLSRETSTRIQPFDLDILREAFQLRETTPVDLPPVSFCSLRLRILSAA